MLKQFKSTVLSCAVSAAVLSGCNMNGVPDALIVLDENGEANIKPVIVMRGEASLSLALGDPFEDPGVIAMDAEDGDITTAVSSNVDAVDTSKAGTYQIIYRVKDSRNAEASPVVRHVSVNATNSENVAKAPTSPGSPVVDSWEDEEFDLNVPPIASVRLVAFTDEGNYVDIEELKNGSVIDLSAVPTHLLNVVADSTNEKATGSVHFRLTGATTIDRWENNPIYTMDVEGDHLDINANELPEGDYRLLITPYEKSEMEGAKGAPTSISFSVIDSMATPTAVPDIVSLEYVGITDTGKSITLKQLKNGDTLDFSKAPTDLVNVVAISKDYAQTGSVHFKLDGPTSIDRMENSAEYTMANAFNHILADATADLDNNPLGFEAGSYTLTVTPYEAADGGGQAGRPVTLKFSVAKGEGSAETPSPQPLANDDFYSVRVNASGGSVSLSDHVGNNDSFDSATASFEVLEPPANGQIEMLDTGVFHYSPDEGFSGQDSFVYQIAQDGVTDDAKVSVNVVKGGASSSEGFTVFKPSSDSKVIYVSNSSGRDANDCLSPATPCKTLGAATEKMRSGKPDHIYLKAGDTWRGQSLGGIQSGRSASEPAVIAFYGQGPRPRLESTGKMLSISNKALNHVSIIGLHLSAFKHDISHPEFTGKHEDGDKVSFLGGHSNILIEDCVFDHMELTIQDWNGKPSNFTLRRNIFTGAYYNNSSNDRHIRPSNLFVKGINGLLIEENVFDYGGWHPKVAGAGANMFNHNLYIQYENVGNSIVVENNIITRASSHGIHGRPGGRYENNFFGRNAISLQMGYKDHPLPKGTFAKALNNVVTEGHSMFKGINACSGNNLCTPALWGITTADIGQGEITVKGNVVHSRATGDQRWSVSYENLKSFGIGLHKPEVTAQAANITWRWASDSEGGSSGYPAPGRTLGDYYTQLQNSGKINGLVASGYVSNDAKGSDNFDTFMNLVKKRNPQTWDNSLTADAINDYIRAGFGK